METKKSAAKDLTNGSPVKLILGFALPLLLGMLFQQFYSMVDTIIVGKFLGAKALAAVGSTGSINFMIVGFCMGICNGFAIPVAQMFGAGDRKALCRYVGNGAVLAGLFSVVMTVLVCIWCRDILVLMKTPSDILDGAYAYIFVIFLGIPLMVLYNQTSAIMRSLGDSRSPLIFLGISSVLNIVLDLVLVRPMGVAGTAWATIIAQGISGFLCLFYMKKKFTILTFQREDWKLHKHYVINLCNMGIPMGLQFSITAIGTIIVQSAVNIYGATHMAGFSAAGKIQNVIGMVAVSMGATIATYVGQNRGADRMDRVKQGVRYSCIMLLVWSVIQMTLVYFGGKYFTYLFINPSETDVIQVSVTYFHTVFWAYPFLDMIFVFRNALQGMGYGLVPMLGGVFELVARTLIVVLVAGHTTFAGVCLADPAAWIAALIPLIPYYFYIMKKSRGN